MHNKHIKNRPQNTWAGIVNARLLWLDFSTEEEWSTFELESATGKNSAREGFGQLSVRCFALLMMVDIRKSKGNASLKRQKIAGKTSRRRNTSQPFCYIL